MQRFDPALLPQGLPEAPMGQPQAQQAQPEKKTPPAGLSDSEILEKAKKAVADWGAYYNTNIYNFYNDRMFIAGTQWDSPSVTDYTKANKVPYTFNKIKPLVKQLCGEQVNMRPKLTLISRDSAAPDQGHTELMSKFLRALAYNSRAAEAYNKAFENQCMGGWGVIKICADYAGEKKFEQEIEILPVPDPLFVGFDPNAKKTDKTDGDWQFYYELMSKDEFKAHWPGKEVPANPWPALPIGIMLSDYNYSLKDTVAVLDFYLRVRRKKTLVQLTDNRSYKTEVFKKDIPAAQAKYEAMMVDAGMDPANVPQLTESARRKSWQDTVYCFKCTQDEVLEQTVWPVPRLPYIYVDGMSYYTAGRQFTESFIFPAKNAQIAYNYCMSEALNALARIRKEKIMATAQQAKGYERQWAQADIQQTHLEYNPDPMAPQGPIFRPPEEISQSFFVLAQQMEEDIYKTLGVYPANRGEFPNETSGVAIGRTLMQANLAFVQLLQNLYNGMQSAGETVLELIPVLYDTQRVVSLLGVDGAMGTTVINNPAAGQDANDVTKTVYGLEVQPVANFAVQQEYIAKRLESIAAMSPKYPDLLADAMLSTIEDPVAPMLTERFKTMVLPPQLQAKEKGQQPPPPPPNPQMELIQAQIQNEQMKTRLMAAQIQQMQADTQLTGGKHMTEQAKAMMQNEIEQKKLEASLAETQAMTEKAYIDSDAEVTKANLEHNKAVMDFMAKIHTAGVSAAQDSP